MKAFFWWRKSVRFSLRYCVACVPPAALCTRRSSRLVKSALIYATGLAGNVFANTYISLKEAEDRALKTSNEIKAFSAQSQASYEQSRVQFGNLLPQWTLTGAYFYDTPNPKVVLPHIGALAFNIKNIYLATTEISYPIWDTFSNLNAYKGAKFLAESKKENEDNTRLQVLYNTRLSYLMVQLSLEQLESVQDSLNLARSQFHDIDINYNAGFSPRLDWISAQRDVFNYELQYEQQKADVTSKVKDLFAVLSLPTDVEIFNAEKNIHTAETTETKIKFDSLQQSLEDVSKWSIQAPNEKLPSLLSQIYLEKSYTAQAESEWVKLLPKVEISARATLIGANIFENKVTEINTFAATVTMPIFDGVRILHNTAQYKQEALSARWNHDQIKINVNRDYQKSLDMVESLKKQKEINKMDVDAAKVSAKLYYESYMAGKSILINVQNANLQVLVSQVQGANITAQILQQLYQLQLTSGIIRE